MSASVKLLKYKPTDLQFDVLGGEDVVEVNVQFRSSLLELALLGCHEGDQIVMKTTLLGEISRLCSDMMLLSYAIKAQTTRGISCLSL